MPVLFDIDFKNDPFYIDGHEEGVKETTIFMIENLLLDGDPIKRVAKISDQTEDFVLSIKRRLIQAGKILPNF